MSELNYHITELMRECINEFNQTFECLLDTEDYVPLFMREKIMSFICKEFGRSWKKIRKADKKYQKQRAKELAEEAAAEEEAVEEPPEDEPPKAEPQVDQSEKALVPVVKEALSQVSK
ncbi:MAG: hypothetical protein J1G38_04510 [Clostridiales bacterium]|nr:hypothetical protein [Clostridiales bacterium]